MKGWTEEAVNAANAKSTLKAPKKVSAVQTQGQRGKAGGKVVKNSAESVSFGFRVEQFAKEHGLTVEKEYRFDKVRRFRFDYCFPELKLGLEFEGIIAGKSRHTSITGYSRDCDKYNLATSLGYRVLRYTALNFNNIETDLLKIKTKEK